MAQMTREEARQEVIRQAQGLGIDPNNIDQSYVTSVQTGGQYAPTTSNKKTGSTSGSSYGNTMYDARKALLDNMLSSQLSRIDQQLNENVTNLNNMRNDVETGYQQNIDDVDRGTYRALERGKIQSSERGLLNSNQQQGMEQGMIRNNINTKSQATIARDNAINDILNNIATLKKNAGIAKQQAQDSYNAGLIGARSEADLAQMQQDWQKEQYYGSQDFQRQMTELQNNFNLDLNKLNHEQQKELLGLSTDAQERLQRVAMSGNMAMFEKQLQAESERNKNQMMFGTFGGALNGTLDLSNPRTRMILQGLADYMGTDLSSLLNSIPQANGPVRSENVVDDVQGAIRKWLSPQFQR